MCVLGAGMKPWHCNHSLMTGCYLTPTFKWMQKIHTDEQLAYFSMPGCVCSIATVSRMPFEPSGFSVHHRFPLPIWVWSIGILLFFRRDVFFYVTEKNKCFHLIFFFLLKAKNKEYSFFSWVWMRLYILWVIYYWQYACGRCPSSTYFHTKYKCLHLDIS